MKKIIYSLFVLAMAAFTFSSCEDVPAPYDMPTKPETPELSTDGTEANPYTVADAKIAATGTNVFVKAFIVGYVPDKALNEAIFGDAASAASAPTNILVAASADETNVTNCMPIQLPAGAIRTALNLKDNPSNLKQEVILCGNIENYFGATGLKSVAYAKIGAKEFGTKPGGSTTTPDTPAGEAKGTGTEADPFNSVAANNLATSLGSGEVSDKEYYIKGKIQEIKDQFAAQFGNATFYIADDENSQKFLIFRTYYFGGEKWKEGDGQLKIGDEVVVCAKLINYMGNTPETNQGGKLISVNGKTSIEGGSETPDTPSTTEGISVNGLTVTLTNSGATAGKSLKVEDLSTLKLDANPTEFTLSDGTIFKLDSNGNKTKPAYNEKAKELRIYANNIMTITGSKNIAKIILTCTHDNNKNTDCVGNETATIKFSGKTATYTNVFTGTTGGGVQLRIKSIEIVYAK
ncbi:DUF6359 domain-containing protein [Prevotellaceae bacterium LCP21S3_C11]